MNKLFVRISTGFLILVSVYFVSIGVFWYTSRSISIPNIKYDKMLFDYFPIPTITLLNAQINNASAEVVKIKPGIFSILTFNADFANVTLLNAKVTIDDIYAIQTPQNFRKISINSGVIQLGKIEVPFDTIKVNRSSSGISSHGVIMGHDYHGEISDNKFSLMANGKSFSVQCAFGVGKQHAGSCVIEKDKQIFLTSDAYYENGYLSFENTKMRDENIGSVKIGGRAISTNLQNLEIDIADLSSGEYYQYFKVLNFRSFDVNAQFKKINFQKNDLGSGQINVSTAQNNKLSLMMNLKNGGTAQLNGSFDEANIIDASFKITATNIAGGCNISSHNQELRIDNMQFKLHGQEIAGLCAIDFLSREVVARLNISNLELASLASVTNYDQFIMKMLEMHNDKYESVYLPIRNISFGYNISANISNLMYKTTNIADSLNISVRVGPGAIDIQEFKARKSNMYLDGRMLFDCSMIKPNIKLSIVDGSVEMQDSVDFSESLKFIKTNIIPSKIMIDGDISMREVFAFGKKLSNLSAKVVNDNANLIIKDVNFSIDRSTFNGSMSLDVARGVQNVVYSYGNFELSGLPFVAPGAVCSMNGSGVTYGEDLDNIVYNARANGQFVCTNLYVGNIDIDTVIKDIQKDPKDNLDNIASMILSAPKMTTAVKDIGGNYSIESGNITLQDVKFLTNLSSGTFNLLANIYKQEVAFNALFRFYSKQQQPSNLIEVRANSTGKVGSRFTHKIDARYTLDSSKVGN